MSFQTDYYAHKLAVDYGFFPVDNSKYEPLELAGNDWNFRIAKKFGYGTNVLMEINGDDIEQG